MKQKSLRQLAKELGVSHSYLSQIKHGKRPPSEKVVSKMVSITRREPGLEDTKYLVPSDIKCYNSSCVNAELCSGSTGDFGSSSPGSNPGSAATTLLLEFLFRQYGKYNSCYP